MRSKWYHLTYFEEITKAEINTTQDVVFNSTEYFPEGFAIDQFKRKPLPSEEVSELEGQVAAAWSLEDVGGNLVRFKDLASKVLMIQFTGVGCGPCHHSLPFLKQLVNDYSSNDFELVAIETWSNNRKRVKRYKEKNKINFKFLKSNINGKNLYGQ